MGAPTRSTLAARSPALAAPAHASVSTRGDARPAPREAGNPSGGLRHGLECPGLGAEARQATALPDDARLQCAIDDPCPAEFKLRFNVYKKIVVSAGLVTSEEEEAWCLSAHVALVLLRDLPLLKSHDTSRYIDLDKTSAFHKGSRDTRRVRHWDRARTPGAE